jgi:hypothetical protein
MRVWDVATGHCFAALPGKYPAAWSPDGATIVAGVQEDVNAMVLWRLTDA